jgi:hypothetical protein
MINYLFCGYKLTTFGHIDKSGVQPVCNGMVAQPRGAPIKDYIILNPVCNTAILGVQHGFGVQGVQPVCKNIVAQPRGASIAVLQIWFGVQLEPENCTAKTRANSGVQVCNISLIYKHWLHTKVQPGLIMIIKE